MHRIILSISLAVSSSTTAQINNCPIVPTPIRYESHSGTHFLNGKILLDTKDAPEKAVDYLRDRLSVLYEVELLQDDTSGLSISLENVDEAAGYYSITMLPEEQTIRYGSEEGLFYAFQSLTQMIREGNHGWEINHCLIEDEPKFGWRGLHLDVSRHFFSVAEVKRFIDLMAMYKFNVFHWHLTDDQGWRIEIRKYPKLTEIGSWRDSTVHGHYSDQPRKYDIGRYGGFYTREDIREIIAFAADRNVTVVPEIEMPGHSRAALAAYPELSCTGERQPVPGLWGIFDDIYCSRSSSIEFMKDVLSEVIELFPSEYIHIGGDEVPKKRWEACEDCKKVMEENHLENVHELQSYFITQIDEFLTSKGKKLIGWDEILEGGLSPNAAVMSWRGEKGGIAAARQKHTVVMSPTTYCYFDYYQSGNKSEPLAIGGLLPLEKVYQFNPIPEALTEEERKYILGGQANVWTEYIPDFEHVEYMVYPRALALIQSLWCKEKPHYEDFLSNYLKYQEDFLDHLNVHFSRSIHDPELMLERAENGIVARLKAADPNAHFDVRIHVNSGKSSYVNAFVMGTQDSIFLERSTDSIDKIITMKITSDALNDEHVHRFLLHSDLGRPIELITPPHPKYNHNGSLTLVDGNRGAIPWKGDEWLGFREQEVSMIVDMEQLEFVDDITIGFLDDSGSWIYLPESVSVKASKNGRCWKKVNVKPPTDHNHFEGSTYRAILGVKARYLKVTVHPMEEIPAGMPGEGRIPWTFMDEIQMLKRSE